MDNRDVEVLDIIGSIMDLVKAKMAAGLKRGGNPLQLMEAHVLRIVLVRGNCTQMDVIRETRRDKAQIGKLIRSLVNHELLVQSPDPDDARRQRLALTAKGRTVAQQSVKYRGQIARQLLREIPSSERLALMEALTKLEHRLEDMGDMEV